MIAPLAKLIDWSALQMVGATRLKSRLKSERKTPVIEKDSKLEEALQFLSGPDFIPAESQPAQVEWYGSVNFRFPTSRLSETPQNNVAYGRLYRCAKDWRKYPTIILLHGSGDFFNHCLRFPFLISNDCNREGINAVTLVLPYHFQRRRRPAGTLDHLRHAEAMAQGVAEIRALAGWLLGEGCPAVALWGISRGGWLAGLTACHDRRLAGVVLAVPSVRIKPLLSTRTQKASQNASYEARARLNRTPLNLTLIKPVIPSENILVIEGTYDLFVETEGIEDLWKNWAQPEIWRLPHGHISWMFAPGLTGRILRWSKPRLTSFSNA